MTFADFGCYDHPFKEAVLKLDVTPNITPDDRILLDLIVNQDSVGDLVPSGNGPDSYNRYD